MTTAVRDDSALEVRIASTSSRLDLKTYTQILGEVRLSLEEVDRTALPVRSPRLRWAIQDMKMERDVRIVLVPAVVPAKRSPQSIATPLNGFVDGVELLTESPKIPPFFSERTVARVGHIGKHIGQGGIGQVAVTSLSGDHHTAVVDEGTVSNATQAILPAKSAFSSVTGTLDVLSHNRGSAPRALIRDPRTRHAVRVVAHSDHSEVLRNAWGRRVIASGVLQRNTEGQAVSLQMTDLEVLPDRRSPVDPAEILGINPRITGDLSTAEYLRQVRSD
ncbi:hypothetical protein [Streptomyces sp. NRRL F-5755]|uniref:hypothetical protein n=1 Tax=Streptomyces sp. NRRL F-5755 TaxID=1519475 RepID=UPI000ABFC3AB|nr:hypothetical protein [Streptomyces sp. NRRL F-5755]